MAWHETLPNSQVYARIGGGTERYCHSPKKTIPRPDYLYKRPFDSKTTDLATVKTTDSPTCTRQHKIWYETFGHGSTKILFLMGLGGTHTQFEPQLLYFAIDRADEYTVLLLDNRGVGFSDIPTGRWKTTDMASDALQVMSLLDGWEHSVHLFGFSMGGMIALEIVLMDPQRFASLTLCSTHAGGLVGTKPPMHGMRPFVKCFSSLGGGDALDSGIELLYPTSHLNAKASNAEAFFRDIKPEIPIDTYRRKYAFAMIRRARKYIEVAGLPENYVEITPEGIGQQIPAVVTHYVSWDRLLALKNYGLKVLVLTGEQDNLVGYWNGKLLSNALDAKWLHFPEAGHGCNEQFQIETNEAIAQMIEETKEMERQDPDFHKMRASRLPVKPGVHPWMFSTLFFIALNAMHLVAAGPMKSFQKVQVLLKLIMVSPILAPIKLCAKPV
jgi:pimeloyl-ACP methyl ester carboxylesterase